MYWYEGFCRRCGQTIRGRILEDGTTTVDVILQDDGWFDDDGKCENPDPVVVEIRDVD